MKAAGGFNYQTLIDVDIIAEGKRQAELFNFYNNLGAWFVSQKQLPLSFG